MELKDKLVLFKYLDTNKEKLNLDSFKEVSVSSIEALALITAISYKENPRKLFFLFKDIYDSQRFASTLSDYLNDDDFYMFLYDEIFRTSAVGVSPEMNDERLLSLSMIYSSKPSILISHTSACMLNILSKEKYENSLIDIKVNDMLDFNCLTKKISSLGYLSTNSVTCSGQFAMRGGILDIFDPAYLDPIRIEFFGDEIDDIRFFHVNDELSFKHIDHIVIHPASLFLLNDGEIKQGKETVLKELKSVEETSLDRLALDDLKERLSHLILDVDHGYLNTIDNRFYHLFSSEDTSLLTHLDSFDKYIFDFDSIKKEEINVKKKESSYFKDVINKNNSIVGEQVFISKQLNFDDFKSVNISSNSFFVRENSYKALSYNESDFMLHQYIKEGYKIYILLPEPNFSNFVNLLNEKDFTYSIYPIDSQLILCNGRLNSGFELPNEKIVYLSCKEILGATNYKSRFLSRYKEAKIIRKYEDLQVGDYVVHEVHGVGKYHGVITLDGLEYLKIEYADDCIFYLPLSQYRLIRKYASKEGYKPALDKFGGSTWSRKKAKIRSKIYYLADQLLMLYAERNNRPGFAFNSERELEEEFMNDFSFPYTESQLQAIDEVKQDMESTHPMDRLIAGDVGFGKTEIAFNAAFKAIINHKQVVLLCPTTLLSNQHYKVALNRFEKYGIHIAIYNRFNTKAEQVEIIKGLKEGSIDFVIGTHGLLSDDIIFKDLGLLIIDEEQKFGVTHKEKIKERSKNIDCLTLTATPIPRTMQMSLLGVRNMSLLTQPPLNRMPVKTYVVKQDNELIYEVIEKELERKGQVYYLHNTISSLGMLADRLQKRFKDKHIGIVHAKMNQDDIESVMNQFYQCEIDILLCTSIVESGLDIPNVNTIIVENADHFGLAQLYQIKGRVGRSERLAYAYFFFNDSHKLTDEAEKRLKALKDFTELGSGYKIAMQDLNIRGAGNILGSEQAGFVDTLGYDAYMDLLSSVLKEKKLATIEKKNERYLELTFSLDAHIPSDYGSESQRITMYKELSDCSSDEQLNKFANKLRDVYGPYPEEVSNLLIKKKIENSLNTPLYSNFIEGLGVYQLVMSKEFSSKPLIYKKLDELLRPLSIKLKMRVTSDRLFEFLLTKTKDYLSDLLFLVETLNKCYQD